MPEHKVDGRLIASTRDGATHWVLAVTHVGSRFDSEALTADQTLPAYTTADCQVLTRLGKHVSVGLEILNVGDKNYEEEVMYPAPGRTVLFSAGLDL